MIGGEPIEKEGTGVKTVLDDAFAYAVLSIVEEIPVGTVATYGQIARLAGMPRCARTVGYAMAGCTDPTVPCHRVVDRFGGTKACFDTFAPGTQRVLLEMEGVVFTPEGRVDLERCQWNP